MKIVCAKTAGFCMGVSLALSKLDAALKNAGSKRTVTFGPIIHNPLVMRHYVSLGVVEAKNIEELQNNDQVLIRAHGISAKLEEELKVLGIFLIDATCPKVKKAQLSIRAMSKKGFSLLLLGELDHPEVKGLLSYADERALVFSSLAELEKTELESEREYFLAAQTTQDQKTFYQIEKHIKAKINTKLEVLNTICNATRKRISDALILAKQCDLVLVIGGYNSGNTRRLVEAVQFQGVLAWHIESAAELNSEELRKFKRIGITAGASTPRALIDEVKEKIKQI